MDTATEGSGLQLAIWDIVQDNGDGLVAGAVRQHRAPNANDLAAYGFASAYITNSLGQSPTAGTVYHNVTFEGAPAQTLMSAETLTPNPEPGMWGDVWVRRGTDRAGAGSDAAGELREVKELRQRLQFGLSLPPKPAPQDGNEILEGQLRWVHAEVVRQLG